ncbi:MAG: response regulator [Victivallales bacterium]|nr:response regulator [Victivallales bacterium]
MPSRILIIDDQPFMIKLLRYNLKKNGYDTITETDGLKALEHVTETAPDLIILDVRMPKITGTELCGKFREIESLRDIPIIILTGQMHDDIEAKSRDAGATDFMTKPFSPSELLATVRKHLEE